METKVMTRAQAQDVVRCTKYCLENENESAFLQKKLLEVGCDWKGENKEVHNEECRYLFVSVNLNITVTNCEEIFIKNKFTELKVKDVLNIEIKENDMETKEMTQKEVFEFLHNAKVICTSSEETAIVQQKLFELGFEWNIAGKIIIENAFLLYIDEPKMFYTEKIKWWVDNDKKQIEPNEILSIQIKEEKPKFDPNTLKPFQQVLVRNEEGCIWLARFYDFNERELGEGERFVTTSGGIYNKCIPYNEDTKHLHGTTEEEPEFYKGCK